MSRGLSNRPRIHDLRHTHVAWLISAGISLPAIQRRMATRASPPRSTDTELCAQVGDLPGAAIVNEHLGDCHHRAGTPTQAVEAWRRAADLLGRLHGPHEAEVRRKVDGTE